MHSVVLTFFATSSLQVTALRVTPDPEWRGPELSKPFLSHGELNTFQGVFETAMKISQGDKHATMVDGKKLREIWDFINDPQTPLEGDIVECGVWMGGASMVMAYAELNAKNTTKLPINRDVWLFDTFEGLPAPDSEKDDPKAKARWGHAKHRPVDKSGKREHVDENGQVRWNWGPLEAVQKNMDFVGYPKERIHYVKGKVEDTLIDEASLPEKIAVLRLDTDWYKSTRVELDVLFPRLVPGGLIQIDDYCTWQGSRTATKEWLEQNANKLEHYKTNTCFTKLKRKQ